MSAIGLYPVRVGESRRYLVDASGRPYLIHGDTAWSLLVQCDEAEVVRYLDDRAAKGFNSIIVNLIEHKFGGPQTRAGERPFLRGSSVSRGRLVEGSDFTAPNEAYFAFADRALQLANERGIQVFLAPIYLGYEWVAVDDDGWYHEALANGVERCREYGRFLGERYARHPNVVWLMGGDRNPGQARPHVDAIAEGIREKDPSHVFTAHVEEEFSAHSQLGSSGWLGLNSTYTYGIVHRKVLFDYLRTPDLPTFLIESSYEGEHNASALQIRRQAYWALLSGGCGQFLGNRPIWGFYPGWEAALDSQGSRDMVHVRRLFESRRWWDLVPDGYRHELLVGGIGEYRGLDTATAAATADGRTAIVYTPARRGLAVDLRRLSGEALVGWWYDPRAGEATCINAFAREGVKEFVPPGEGDWALVIDDAALGLGAPGLARAGA